MCASTGKFNLEKLTLEEVDENEDEDVVPKTLAKVPAGKKPMVRRQTDSVLDTKSRGGSLKKSGTKTGANGVVRTPPTAKKQVTRTGSNK